MACQSVALAKDGQERPLLVLSHFILHLNIDQAYHSQASSILSCSAHTAVIKYGVVAMRLMAPNGFYVNVTPRISTLIHEAAVELNMAPSAAPLITVCFARTPEQQSGQ